MSIMHIEDFFKRVANEPERTVAQTVWTTPAETFAEAGKPSGMVMTKFLSTPGRQEERRDIRYRHVLGSPAPQEAIDTWQAEHPSHPLPADLRALENCVNGIHLWANVESGRSYTGLAPIEEWDLARVKMYGPSADRSMLDDRYVAISYHQDGASFVVLDVASGKYFLMDVAGPDASSPIASNVGELLDWLWGSRIAPRG